MGNPKEQMQLLVLLEILLEIILFQYYQLRFSLRLAGGLDLVKDCSAATAIFHTKSRRRCWKTTAHDLVINYGISDN